MNTKTQRNRHSESLAPTILFRPSEDIADLVYAKFNTLAHRQNLMADDEREPNVYVIPKVPTFAARIWRRETFTSAELRQIRDLIQDANAEVINPLVAVILGDQLTISWIDNCLAPTPKKAAPGAVATEA